MKYIFFLLIALFFAQKSDAQFGKLFQNKTLRLDYYHCGNADSEKYYFDELIQEPYWAGSEINLIDTNVYGNQFVEVYTADTNELIYSRGYSTLFGEWQSTPEAKTTDCCYPESIVMPFPREKVIVTIVSRNKKGEMEKVFEYRVDPKSYFIKNEREKLPVFDVVHSGDPNKKVDIVLLPEGYTEDQQDLFQTDCERFANEFFSYAPYSENKNKFNIRGVWAPSKDSGLDIPAENTWNKTRLNGSYYTFDSERYLMIKDFQGVRDVAANAPYDYIYILANTDKYGGGAIYNFYGISAAHHIDETGKIYIHEFGHLFAGLGDEYVGGVEYSEFYPADVEPWEPNLTTLVDFDKKWKNSLPEGTEIPTPQKQENNEKLGVYEGGGYVSKGVYRPWINCMMNNLHTINVFCPVCSKSIQEMIDFNCK
ncbi:MAG TPA: M64 family metallopeptidase [Prolixibacteraceae bacterium]|nr:M64 family metallopeptidase [Prolixibacteraceae bacterium]